MASFTYLCRRYARSWTFPQIPTREQRRAVTPNPLRILVMLTPMQGCLVFVCFCAWMADSFDFFCVSLSVVRFRTFFNRKDDDITTAITLTLLLRSLGAFLFGMIADRFGRKWVLVGVLCLISILQIGSGFIETFSQFLGVRSLFGIAMGGVWGIATATMMENIPAESRGLFSGVINAGYPTGYLLASMVNLWLVPEAPKTWRSLFWTGAGISAFIALLRALLPESAQFLKEKQSRIETEHKTKLFLKETGTMLKDHWIKIAYGLMIMTGFNFFSHGSQDLYPTFMQSSKGFSAFDATRANIVGECGAVVGSLIGGYLSQYFGRRVTMIVSSIIAACLIPLWILPSSYGALCVGAFLIQVGINSAWGVVGIFLNELSPPAYRGTFPGFVYQLGNMASSAAAQIEATAGNHIRLRINGESQPDYGVIQAILIAIVAGWIIFWAFVGPEKYGAQFEKAKTALELHVGEGSEKSFHEDGKEDIEKKDEKEGISTEHVEQTDSKDNNDLEMGTTSTTP